MQEIGKKRGAIISGGNIDDEKFERKDIYGKRWKTFTQHKKYYI